MYRHPRLLQGQYGTGFQTYYKQSLTSWSHPSQSRLEYPIEYFIYDLYSLIDMLFSLRAFAISSFSISFFFKVNLLTYPAAFGDRVIYHGYILTKNPHEQTSFRILQLK